MKERYILKKEGGMLATLGVSHLEKKKKRVRLYFRKRVRELLKERGFCWAKVEIDSPSKIRVKFSRKFSEEYPFLLSCSEKRSSCQINLPFSLKRKNFPLKRRIGKIGWLGPDELVIYFDDPKRPSFFKKEILKEKRKILKGKRKEDDKCFLKVRGKKPETCFLVFSLSMRDFLKKLKAKGARIEILGKKFLLFFLEKDCYLSCKDCTRIDCLSISFWKREAKIPAKQIVKEMGYNWKDLKNWPQKLREGKIYFLPPPNPKNSFLVYFPYLP